jgi:DNA-binding SARP family transcriptional activator
MEILWPGEPLEVATRRLSVALATARAVLDPEKRHPPGQFIVADKDALRLDLASLPVDVERFLIVADEGLARLREGRLVEARAALQTADALDNGDFLEEDRYQDWAEPLREEARAVSISVARALGELAVSRGDHDAAIRCHLRILEKDAFDEQAHLGLVAILEREGRHGEAHRRYRAYVARMVELQVPAAPFPRPSELEIGVAEPNLNAT